MGICKSPKKAKLIFGILTANNSLFDISCSILARRFGEIDFISEATAFNFTTYYNEELGEPIWRKFVSFRNLIFSDALAEIKLFSNQVEQALSFSGKRRINLDPGILSENSIILASTKENPFRLYLGKGIFGELTLIFIKGEFQQHFWTYPDFRKEITKDMLARIRKIYLSQKKGLY